MTPPAPVTLAQIVAALSVTYTDEGVAIWLTSPNTWANDQRPIEMIADGKADEVAKIVGWIGDADPSDFVVSERDR